MKRFSLIFALGAALVLSVPAIRLVNAQEAEAKKAHPKWEYKVLPSRRGSASENELNKLGDDGWELVAVRSVGTAEAVFYFKRREL